VDKKLKKVENDSKNEKKSPFDYEKYLFSKNPKPAKEKKPGETMQSIKNAIGSALDEDVAEIAEASLTKVTNASEIEEAPSSKKKSSFKRSAYFFIGIVVSFLSLIGFISTVGFVSDAVSNITNNTKQKEEFAQLIYPAVIVDPPAFDKASQLSSETIIGAAIWDIILHEDTSKYPQEYGTMTIPQLDVELHATKLFGQGLSFEHKTIGDAALTFYYTEDSKSYNVPVSPKYFPYSPLIENITRNGDTYTLTVGYVSPSPEWLIQKGKGNKIKPDKYMEYILTKSGNSYILSSIKEPEGQNSSNDAF
jgi:hypothetical protein